MTVEVEVVWPQSHNSIRGVKRTADSVLFCCTADDVLRAEGLRLTRGGSIYSLRGKG